VAAFTPLATDANVRFNSVVGWGNDACPAGLYGSVKMLSTKKRVRADQHSARRSGLLSSPRKVQLRVWLLTGTSDEGEFAQISFRSRRTCRKRGGHPQIACPPKWLRHAVACSTAFNRAASFLILDAGGFLTSAPPARPEDRAIAVRKTPAPVRPASGSSTWASARRSPRAGSFSPVPPHRSRSGRRPTRL
jgi:hypothetical protein